MYKSIFKCFQVILDAPGARWNKVPWNGDAIEICAQLLINSYFSTHRCDTKQSQKMSPVALDGVRVEFDMYAFEICGSL